MTPTNQPPAPNEKVSPSFLKRNPRFNATMFSFLAVGLLLTGFVVYSTFASEGPTDFNDKADTEAQAKALTSSVKVRSAKYASSKRNRARDEQKNKDTVTHVAAQRRLAMRKLMLTKPEVASSYVLPDEAKANLPDEAKKSVESRTTLDGTWTTSMDERFDPKTGKITSAKPLYSITTKDTSLNVSIAKVPGSVRHLDTVKLSGVTIDGMVAVSKDGVANKQLSVETSQKIAKLPLAAKLLGVEPVRAAITTTAITPYNPTAIGTKQVAVYMVNFSNDKAIPSFQDDAGSIISMNKEILDQYLTTKSNSVRNYYLTQSTNMYNPNFTVHNWYTASANNTVDCTDYAAGLLTDSFLASTGSAIDARDKTATPNTRIFLFNRVNCANGSKLGAGAIGAFPTPAAGNIPVISYILGGESEKYFKHTIAHEMGHTLGLSHASKDTPLCKVDCSLDNSAMTDREYGDIYDVMGGGQFGESSYYNGFHQTQLGWRNGNYYYNGGPYNESTSSFSANIFSSSYTKFESTLPPIEEPFLYDNIYPTGARIISIQGDKNIDSSFSHLNIEYRQRVVNYDIFDKFSNFSTGVFDKQFDPEPGIVIYDSKVPNLDKSGFSTLLRNPSYGKQDYFNGHVLRIGQTYTDNRYNIKITYVSNNPIRDTHVGAKIKVEGIPHTSPPGKVTNIKTTSLYKSVRISWSNPSDKDLTSSLVRVDSYSKGMICQEYVENRDLFVNFIPDGCINKLDPGQKYYITITTRDRWGNSTKSDKVDFTIPAFKSANPMPAEYRTASRPKINKVLFNKGVELSIKLSWSAISEANSYKIYRNDGKILSSTGNSTEYNDKDISPYKFYSYNIVPVFNSNIYLYPSSRSAQGVCRWDESTYQWMCQGGFEKWEVSSFNSNISDTIQQFL